MRLCENLAAFSNSELLKNYSFIKTYFIKVCFETIYFAFWAVEVLRFWSSKLFQIFETFLKHYKLF